LNKFGGLVPRGSCQTVDGDVVLVGDAACQVKPLSQGGIYYGMKAAEILAKCITANKIKNYDREWKKLLGREISIGLKVKRAYERLDEQDIGGVFDLMKDNADIIEKMGDFESHSKVILEIMKNPKAQKKIGGVLWKLLKGNVLS